MRPPGWDDLAVLREQRSAPCVSIYMPVHRAGRDTEQDPLRFKNLLDAAAIELDGSGRRGPAVTELLQPGSDLLGQRPFWSHQEDGLAVFLAPGTAHVFTLPYAVPEQLVTGGRFHLRPLLLGAQPNKAFFALTLTRRGVRLLHGDRFLLEEVPLHDAPAGLEDVYRTIIEPEERQIQGRTAARAGNRETMIFHGHGLVRDTDDVRLLEYFREVDASVMRALRNTQEPLVLAGLDYLLPLYRQAAGYEHILTDAATGNVEDSDDRELHERLWAIVAPLALAHLERRRAGYDERAAQGEAAHGLEPVLAAAWQGRVETLFVAGDAALWGRLNEQTGEPVLHETRRPGDDELLDRAVIKTLEMGGEAYGLARATMPGNAAVAAVFRY